MAVAMEEIVVTATRLPEPAAPPGTSVITATDIRRSTAHTLGEVLAGQANVQLRGYGGSDNNAAIDIRGMGDTAASNVLVVVDGVRLNEHDLSGADLTTLPLSNIERIEVLRGGGVARYGDGAVGGVINITTRPAGSGPAQGKLSLRAASYDTFDLQGQVSASSGDLSAGLAVSRLLSDGYRVNEDVTAYNASLDLRWTPGDQADGPSLRVRISTHHDVSGLPGPVSASAFAASEAARRGSNAPFDESISDDHRFTLGLNAGSDARGRVDLTLSRRLRDNPFLIGYTPLVPRDRQEGLIQSRGWDLSAIYNREFGAEERRHTLRAGYEWRGADYTRLENGQQVLDSSTRRQGELHTSGLFAESTLALGGGLSLHGGLRLERFASDESDARYTRDDCQTTMVEISPGVFIPVLSGCVDAYRMQKRNSGRWWNQGAELGLDWRLDPALSAFASFSRHFRNPNVDEMLLADTHLRPQSGQTLQAGLRWRPRRALSLNATMFSMRTRDEIYYGPDPVSGLNENRNYEDTTRRDGGELELNWRPVGGPALRAGLGYLWPVFAGSGADIPHVPRLTLNGELEWPVSTATRWVLAMRHVGRRYDGNDPDNTLYPALPAHTVWDLALRRAWRGLRLSIGVNNLFDEVYSVLGYSASYYPMPGRNLHLSLQYDF
jgi:outer membrane receptor protein involved in Fe transport